MDAFMEEFQHLKIQLKEIQSATDNFGENKVIGRGGFGNVYKGAISHKEKNFVAIKRLDRKHGQGNTEFWREITMLSRYTHENLISLVGFCDEGGEKILVYEHAYHGSLDVHLSSTSLTWSQRIKICLDAARGLRYLHDDKGTQQRVLHRDIKSSNILLDENWKAKVSDMGLSKIGPSNQQHTVIVTHVVGTIGYLDPMYMQTGILSKESDVYSFGVVLFEVLCGRVCFEKSNGHILVHSWKQSYNQNKLVDIIFKDILKQMYPESLQIFSDIAFQSLQESRVERPTMTEVVEKLESALEIQEFHEVKVEGIEFEPIGTPSMLVDDVEKVVSHHDMLVDDVERVVSLEPGSGTPSSMERSGDVVQYITAYALVEVLEGSDLKPSGIFGKANPYVKCQLGAYQVMTKIQKKTLSPKWFEEFRIPIISWDSLNILKIEVFDKCYFVNDYFMGNCSIQINDFRYGQRHDMWLPLQKIKMGRLRLAITVMEIE